MVAVGCRDVTPPRPNGQFLLLHDPHDLLVIDGHAIAMQLGGNASIAVAGELGADLADLFDDDRILDPLGGRFLVVGRGS